MKRIILILTSLLFSKLLFAEHITGGEMYYSFMGIENGEYKYHVTLKLYRDCFSAGAQLDPAAAIAIFVKGTNTMVWSNSVTRTRTEQLNLQDPGACITNAPAVCYQVGYYEFDVTLPGHPSGYVVAYQRCCRINGISNLIASGSIGATYTAEIPGTLLSATAPQNNSARFVGKDTVIVCGGYPFTYNFGATDADPNDRLRFSFCQAYSGGGQANSPAGGPNTPTPNPPAAPPYNSANYNLPFTSNAPLGPGVRLDPNTGMITGISPAQGIYVVTVCVEEIRNGIVIATQRKDVQIKAAGCDVAKAQLKTKYTECGSLILTFNNLIPPNPLIKTYYWEFGDPASGADNSSTSEIPTHAFTAPGEYTIKLVTNRNQDCSDSTTSVVSVWPGFFPGFTNAGICVTRPVAFQDITTTNFGVVDSWFWNFGDGTTLADTSHDRHPSWLYNNTGPKEISLTVTNSKGCISTFKDTVNVIDRPPITLAFRDTLICVPDAIQLQASGTGVFNWTPLANITNANTATPTVNPASTTWYYVELNEQGCINHDSVRIRVVDHVTLNARVDTTSCQGDPVQLTVESDGLRYNWTPTASLSDPTAKNPVATPTVTTTYQVQARIGSCLATDDLTVFVVPYPFVNAGPDTTICYSGAVQLRGVYRGTTYSWTPASYLDNPNTAFPIAKPPRTTAFVLTVYDTIGCPKPGRDTVVVNVLPRIRPWAGNDTMVVIGQPLQLNAEGGVSYIWTPSTALNNPRIKSPIAIYDAVDSVRYMVEVFNEKGCSDSAFVNVIVFKTSPSVFVPTAFTPNGDGRNDVIKPVAVGVKDIEYFSIYNRWGNLVFTTRVNGQGWDGRLGGVPQASNVYVWMVKAIDYLGKPVFLKGTVTLIR